MPNSNRKTIFTTISVDKETATLVEKICKRYTLKKSEVVKLAFVYIDKEKLLQLIQLYAELSACGVMDSKRKENLKAEITNLINT